MLVLNHAVVQNTPPNEYRQKEEGRIARTTLNLWVVSCLVEYFTMRAIIRSICAPTNGQPSMRQTSLVMHGIGIVRPAKAEAIFDQM